VLTRNFFSAGGWQDFVRDREGKNVTVIEEVSVGSIDGREEEIRRVAERLKLEAIMLGEKPRAFINDKLLTVGDTLLVRDEIETYECEIVGIEEREVFIRWGETKIQLKLMQAIEDY
jgi:hypothetical protein